ncbi:hypothetical protein Tco_0984707, partial [Tanacetum coccineum]
MVRLLTTVAMSEIYWRHYVKKFGALDAIEFHELVEEEEEEEEEGLMLGLAASYRGTMQPKISKLATLVSVGLLYEGYAHPQTMEIILGSWTEYVSGGVTFLDISSTKHKERLVR